MCSLPVLIPGMGKGCDKHQLQQDECEASTDANVMPGCKWGTREIKQLMIFSLLVVFLPYLFLRKSFTLLLIRM